jgi:hypothetical protein
MNVIALSFEIFRRIDTQVTAFDAQNIVHDVLSLETSPTTRKLPQFVDFDEKWP